MFVAHRDVHSKNLLSLGWHFVGANLRTVSSNQGKLAPKKCFGVTLRRAALHTPDPRQSPKGFVVEPPLGALAAEMRNQQLDLALQRDSANRHVDVRLPDIAVPRRNFIFEDLMIPERIPRQLADLAMILMRIVAPVGQ